MVMVAGPARADKIKHPVAVFAGLDKITGRTIAFQAAAGETVQFGSLQITERACYTRPATEAPQTTTFVEVDEVLDAANQYKRIFSGRMFAASPGLHGIEHPIYDIWLTGCEGGEALNARPEAPAEVAPVPPASSPKTRPKSHPVGHAGANQVDIVLRQAMSRLASCRRDSWGSLRPSARQLKSGGRRVSFRPHKATGARRSNDIIGRIPGAVPDPSSGDGY